MEAQLELARQLRPTDAFEPTEPPHDALGAGIIRRRIPQQKTFASFTSICAEGSSEKDMARPRRRRHTRSRSPAFVEAPIYKSRAAQPRASRTGGPPDTRFGAGRRPQTCLANSNAHKTNRPQTCFEMGRVRLNGEEHEHTVAVRQRVVNLQRYAEDENPGRDVCLESRILLRSA